MKNPRITKRELGLIKGGMNRAFSRSELRRKVLTNAIIPGYSDPERKRVKTWVRCADCKKPEAISNIDVDHIDPRVPIGVKFEDMSLDEYRDRSWCSEDNLQPLCHSCHDKKSAVERKLRKAKK